MTDTEETAAVRGYFPGAIAGIATGALATHSLVAGDGPFEAVIIFVATGGVLGYSSALGASVGGADKWTFATAGFGFGLMVSPLFYAIAWSLLAMVGVAIEL